MISLPPFLPQEKEDETAEILSKLVKAGYTSFMANNVAHLGMLRAAAQEKESGRKTASGDGLAIASGPYLYSFNSRAVAWLAAQGVSAFVSPHENSRKNLEAVFSKQERRQVILPVFAYPALFRMRFDLPDDYDFTWFYNKREETFRAVSTNSGSAVVPAVPYSIADKKALLTRLGFSRFLFDFTNSMSSRKEIRAVMDSFHKELPLQDISRFNWKDGFYDPDKVEELRQLSASQQSERKKVAAKSQSAKKRGPKAKEKSGKPKFGESAKPRRATAGKRNQHR